MVERVLIVDQRGEPVFAPCAEKEFVPSRGEIYEGGRVICYLG